MPCPDNCALYPNASLRVRRLCKDVYLIELQCIIHLEEHNNLLINVSAMNVIYTE